MTRTMKRISLLFALLTAMSTAAPAFSQTPITPGPATPAQMEANKQIVLNFFKGGPTGVVANANKYLADDYIQHNPRFLQFDEEHHLNGKEGFIAAIQSGILAPHRAPGAPPPPPMAPRVPAIVMTQGNFVTVVWKQMRPDPKDPSKMYASFAFDTFRMKDGKMAEHWDGALLQ